MRNEEKEDYDVATNVNYDVAYFLVGLILYVISKRALRELEAPQRLRPPFEGEHLERV
jgi:hypothetical protein